jgi:hypothetical protein
MGLDDIGDLTHVTKIQVVEGMMRAGGLRRKVMQGAIYRLQQEMRTDEKMPL